MSNDQPLDLSPIEGRCDAATKGPWRVTRTGVSDFAHDFSYIEADGTEFIEVAWKWPEAGVCEARAERTGHANGVCGTMPDAQFIAHAREDIPALLAEVKRLRMELDRARDAALEEAAKIADDENVECCGDIDGDGPGCCGRYVVGKNGRIADAIRQRLQSTSAKEGGR